MSKFNVNIPDINNVVTVLGNFSKSMGFNQAIIGQMVQQAQEWNDDVGKKFKLLMEECEKSITSVMNSCEDTTKELNAVKKEIEDYYDVF